VGVGVQLLAAAGNCWQLLATGLANWPKLQPLTNELVPV
jgi:hypothetical protein